MHHRLSADHDEPGSWWWLPRVRAVIDDYLKSCGIDTKPALEADNLAMAMSLIASTRSVALLPAYMYTFSPVVGHQPPSERGRADDRSGRRVQQSERVANPEAVPLENR